MHSLASHLLHFIIVIVSSLVLSFEHQEIVRPKIVSSEKMQDFVYVSIANWTLKLHKNDHFILSPQLMHSSSSVKSMQNCAFYYGWIVEEEKSTLSSLTICEKQFYASIAVGEKLFFVEPLNDQHFLYEGTKYFSRSRRQVKSSVFYDLNGDTFEIDDEIDTVDVYVKKNRNEDQRLGHFSNSKWTKNNVPGRRIVDKSSTPRWLELAVIADYSVIHFHNENVRQYILSLLNIVSTIYQDPFLDTNLKIVVVRMLLYPDKKDGMVEPGNARQSLENVNKWNRKILSTKDVNHDIALWLTKLDIGGPSGYAPVAGACDPARSCALNRDEGLSSAFIIAHEIGHVLGLSHDGDKSSRNNCYREARRGSVMAPIVAATFHNFRWSTCSKKELNYKIKQWTCLLNRPIDKKVEHVERITHEALTMNNQCRMEFGEGYELCQSIAISNPCSHLWCGRTNVTNVCKTKKASPLEGTICGDNKWCVNGSCEPIDHSKVALSEIILSEDNSWTKCPTKEFDTCGVCNGNGSTCQTISNKFERKLRRGVTRLVIIPEAAYDIKVDVIVLSGLSTLQSNLTVMFKDRHKQRYDISRFHLYDKGKAIIVEGTTFFLRKTDNSLAIWAKGPTLGEIIISVVIQNVIGKRGPAVRVFSKYVINRNNDRSKIRYKWMIGDWEPCSVACGGGIRYKTILCKNEITGKIVIKRKCSTMTKPNLVSEQCNMLSCDFKWLVGPWETCSATCGNNGIQRRQIYCVRKVYNISSLTAKMLNNHFQFAESTDKCNLQIRPSLERSCNRITCF